MELALGAVVDSRISFGQALGAYGVPQTTFYSKYRANHSDKLGKPPVLSTLEEKTLTRAMMITADYSYLFTNTTITEFTQLYLN